MGNIWRNCLRHPGSSVNHTSKRLPLIWYLGLAHTLTCRSTSLRLCQPECCLSSPEGSNLSWHQASPCLKEVLKSNWNLQTSHQRNACSNSFPTASVMLISAVSLVWEIWQKGASPSPITLFASLTEGKVTGGSWIRNRMSSTGCSFFLVRSQVLDTKQFWYPVQLVPVTTRLKISSSVNSH